MAQGTYPEVVDGWGMIVAGLVGLVTGVFATAMFQFSERQHRGAGPSQQATSSRAKTSGLDDGVVRVLAVLRSAAVVLGDDNEVIRASAPAYALGVVRHDQIAHERIAEMIAQVRRSGEIVDEELDVPRGPSGQGNVILQVRVAQVDPRHIVVLATDRTESRRLEATRQDFVVNISHELKTPVGALSLLAETVQDAADDAEAVRRFSGRMQSEAMRLGALVHEIIELSRLQVAGALREVDATPVRTIIAESIDRARTGATSREVSLEATGDLDSAVYGDHDLLVTAMRNLLDNAVAYSSPGSAVNVTVTRVRDFVEIAVVDRGEGISADVQDRIFERFYRVDPARSRETGGTGLGLSIVKHVVADHGGEIDIWSRPGRGSTFTIRIPAAPRQVPPVQDPQDRAEEPAA